MYCEECLFRQLEIERMEVSKLEEKYIFYKEYEASVSTSELTLLKEAAVSPQEEEELEKQEKQLNEALSQLRKREETNDNMIKELKQKVLDLNKE